MRTLDGENGGQIAQSLCKKASVEAVAAKLRRLSEINRPGKGLIDELILNCVPNQLSIGFHIHLLEYAGAVCIYGAHAEIQFF